MFRLLHVVVRMHLPRIYRKISTPPTKLLPYSLLPCCPRLQVWVVVPGNEYAYNELRLPLQTGAQPLNGVNIYVVSGFFSWRPANLPQYLSH